MNSCDVLSKFRDLCFALGESVNAILQEESQQETWVTTTQAYVQSGISKRTIQNWARTGKVKSRAVGARYEVLLEDVIRRKAL